jgi:NADH-quinone oxidoreductase subunit L
MDANFLPWLIPLPPFIACALILLVLGRSKALSVSVAMVGIVISLLLSWGLVLHVAANYKALGTPAVGVFASTTKDLFGQTWLANGDVTKTNKTEAAHSEAPATEGAATEGAAAEGDDHSSGDKAAAGTFSIGSGTLDMGVMVDPLTTIMLFMVPLACFLIFLYAIGYMANDPRQARFFAYLSLFAGAMLTLVVADNLLLLFVGWEIMGLCSYLLIGFWYEKTSAYQAAMKAFMTTRVADVIMMVGIGYLWLTTGTLNFREIMHNEAILSLLASVQPGAILGVSAATIIGMCIVTGTVGKSAQFPLHVWLPDAMEGPTPVSAMIHAAAMVSAGVYLLIRMYPVISAGSNLEEGLFTPPVIYMGIIGATTAIFAATIAIAQNDIKRVLAYSTISQLGFMVAALGIGAWVAAAFHLITHAFFKALLFLASGSVIHAMEHGHHHTAHGDGHGDGHSDSHGDGHDAHAHDPHDDHAAHGHDDHATPAHTEPAFDPQDMRNMGGLWRRIPVTAVCFAIGGAALMGFPFITAGFWSKDEIFLDAWDKLSKSPLAFYVLVCLGLSAIMTAFYTFRQLVMTFWGQPRTEAAKHAILNDGTTKGRNISWQLQAPLMVLAFFSIVAGFAGVHKDFPIFGGLVNGVLDSLRFGVQPFGTFLERTLLEAPHHPTFTWIAPLISLLVFSVGTFLGWYYYARKPIEFGQPDVLEGVIGTPAYRTLQNKYYLDELYAAAVVRPFKWFADKIVGPILDRGLIDGTLHAVADAARWFGELCREFNFVVIDGISDGIPRWTINLGRSLRSTQSGRVQQYLIYTLIAALLLILIVAAVAVEGIRQWLVGNAFTVVVALAVVVGAVALIYNGPRRSEG